MTITTVTQITKTAKRFGWRKDHAGNGSHYYSVGVWMPDEKRMKRFRFRFSNHALGETWYGREQTAGCDDDFYDWKKSKLSQEQLDNMFRYPEVAGDLECGMSVDEAQSLWGPLLEIKEVEA